MSQSAAVVSVKVKPSTGLGLPRPDPIKIHTLDLVVPLVWVPIYYFFPPVSQADHPVKETILNLISSLADVLEHFPPLAGSVRPDESGNLFVHSDAVGADFVYELRNEPFPGEHAQGLDPREIVHGIPTPGDPLTAVKFTAFTCGTYALCIAVHHMLGDLTSMMYFTYAFARRFANKPYLSTVPKSWVREPLKYFDTPASPVSSLSLLDSFPGFTILPPGQSPPPHPLPEPNDLVQIYTTTQKLNQIKNSINSSASAPGVSTFQVLTALLWQPLARIWLSDLPEDQVINLGIAVNGRERAPTRAMVQDHFYGNINTAACVSLTRGQLFDADVAFIATAVKKALKEQLVPELIARKMKTFDTIDSKRFVPTTIFHCTAWPKDLVLDGDLNFGFKFTDDEDDASSPKGKRKVIISAGDDIPLPVGVMQTLMVNEETYKTLISIPRGTKDVMLEQVKSWSIEKPKVILTVPQDPPSDSQPRV